MRKIDYSKKIFKNPAIYRKKERGMKKGFWVISIFLVFIVFINYFIFYSPLFKIQHIILNDKNINKNALMPLLTNKNLIFLDKEAIKKSISEIIAFESINIKRKFPNTVTVEVKEVVPEIIWVTQNKAYLMNAEGQLYSVLGDNDIEKINQENYNIVRHKYIYKNIPFIFDKNNIKIQLNKNIIQKKDIQFIKNIYQNINKKIDINILYYEISLNDYTLELITTEGIKIYFSFQDNPDVQIERLSLIYQNKDTLEKIEYYIDLRYGDKVFYK